MRPREGESESETEVEDKEQYGFFCLKIRLGNIYIISSNIYTVALEKWPCNLVLLQEYHLRFFKYSMYGCVTTDKDKPTKKRKSKMISKKWPLDLNWTHNQAKQIHLVLPIGLGFWVVRG